MGKLDWPRFGGVVAQLVERLNGIQEVRGSNPLGSTTQSPVDSPALSTTKPTIQRREALARVSVRHIGSAARSPRLSEGGTIFRQSRNVGFRRRGILV